MGQVERYVYDKEGNLSQKTDRNGIITQYAFNIYGAPLYQREKGSSQGNSYQYTPEGLLKAAISDRMQYSYEYDIMGRLKKKSASGRTLLSYQYDLNGNMVSQEDVTGKVTEYTYNMLDLMQTVTDNGAIVAEYTYYPDSTVKSLHNGSLHTEYTYDADKNISSLKTMLGTDVIVENYYDYDHNGNRTAKRQTGGDTRYTYDALNQLTKVEYPAYTEQLYYDRAGNRKRRVAKGIEELYQYDARNRLTGYTKGGIKTKFTYDNAGNLLTDDRARYTYDAFNRTKKVETYFSPHTQVNHYDAEGLRSEMIEDGKLVQFIFRGDEVAAEEKDSNIVRFIRGYDLVASDAEKAKTYYHYACDEMGSITHLVEEDSVKNCYEYDAWGNLAVCEETVENRFKYNGQQLDPITRQYYLRARFYNPVIARFTQEDTYRGDGLNLYVYCRNNPVYYVDPSGHICFKELVQKFVAQGMSEADAYEKARQELHKQLLEKYPDMNEAEVNRRMLEITDKTPANDYGYWKKDADGNYVYTHKKRTNNDKNISDDTLVLSQAEYEQSVLNANGFRNVNGLADYLSRIPSDAKKIPWKQIPGGAKEGKRYTWTDANGNEWASRAHSIDPSAPPGSNASQGWVYRVEVRWGGKGKTYFMDGTGNYHPKNVMNPASADFYDPQIANDTHIPLNLK